MFIDKKRKVKVKKGEMKVDKEHAFSKEKRRRRVYSTHNQLNILNFQQQNIHSNFQL
jgi:hypothetical protein